MLLKESFAVQSVYTSCNDFWVKHDACICGVCENLAVILCALNGWYRLSEQSRLVAEQKRLVNELRGRYEEAQQWNLKYKVCVQITDSMILILYQRAAKVHLTSVGWPIACFR